MANGIQLIKPQTTVFTTIEFAISGAEVDALLVTSGLATTETVKLQVTADVGPSKNFIDATDGSGARAMTATRNTLPLKEAGIYKLVKSVTVGNSSTVLYKGALA